MIQIEIDKQYITKMKNRMESKQYYPLLLNNNLHHCTMLINCVAVISQYYWCASHAPL